MADALKIAVADDEVDMRDYFQKILPRLGHQVVSVACDGRQLVEQCRKLLPDLVITDIRMPELDGLSAARQITRELAIPILLVTAHESAAETDDDGAEMVVLTKPVDQLKLKAGIASATEQSRQA